MGICAKASRIGTGNAEGIHSMKSKPSRTRMGNFQRTHAMGIYAKPSRARTGNFQRTHTMGIYANPRRTCTGNFRGRQAMARAQDVGRVVSGNVDGDTIGDVHVQQSETADLLIDFFNRAASLGTEMGPDRLRGFRKTVVL